MSLLDLKVAHQVPNREPATQWKERYRRFKYLTFTKSYTPIIDVAESIDRQQQYMMELWEAAKDGDLDNFIKCLEKFSKDNNTPLSTIFRQLTVPDQDTFLHVAASYGHRDLAYFIADHFSELLTRRNHKGNTPLHLAARAGHFGVVAMFLRVLKEEQSNKYDRHIYHNLQTDEEKETFHMRRLEERVALNDEGNTALHEAMLYDHKDVASCLIEFNVEAAYFVNKQGKSPLYLAVEFGNIEYVRNILLARSDYMHLLDEQLIGGRSLLHAAIRRKSIEILKEIAEKKPMLIIHFKDEDGHSPPRFATSSGFVEGDDFLQVWFKNVTNNINAVNTREIRIEDMRPSDLWKERNERLQRLIERSPEAGSKLCWDQPMSHELYVCAEKGDIDAFLDLLSSESNPVSVIYNQKTPLQNTLLHVAASFGNDDLAGFIVHHFKCLFNLRNQRGDTALHIASAAGHLAVVQILLRFQIDQMRKDSFLDASKMSYKEIMIGKFKERILVNSDGNTPLHEALINNHGKVAEYLMKEKTEDAHYVNKQGKSALYMAIEASNIVYVKTILSANLSYAYQYILYEEATRGKSLVRAAIKSRNLVILQEIMKMKTAVTKISDENGQTPLHYAASINYAEGVQFLLDKHKMDFIEEDADGFFPIHCASKYGHVGILMKLLQNCLHAREFVNKDGQNILHIAAKHGKYGVVGYILKTPALELLLNVKDKEGNTPLHLAAKDFHPKVVHCLTWDNRVDLKLVNNEGLTALEVAEENMEGVTSYRQRLTRTGLISAGAGRAKKRKKPKFEGLRSGIIEPYDVETRKDRVNTLLLVSTLIATVTFAAIFTMPGGLNDSEPHHGMVTLENSLIFHVFVICDTIAMYSAVLSSIILIWAQLGVLTLVFNSLGLAVSLLGISLGMMCLAFLLASYVVVIRIVWLSHVVYTLGIVFFTFLAVLYLPLNLPCISYYYFCFLMWVSGSYFDPDIEYVEPCSTSSS